MSKIIYIASPYSHPIDDIRTENYNIVAAYTANLVESGVVAFSPIAYGHTLSGFKDMPTDFYFWENFCLTFLFKCEEMHVLKMPGWDLSKGVKQEMDFCLRNNIPIKFVEYEL